MKKATSRQERLCHLEMNDDHKQGRRRTPFLVVDISPRIRQNQDGRAGSEKASKSTHVLASIASMISASIHDSYGAIGSD